MRIVLRTQVKGNYKEIMARFDRELFEALAPKLAKIKLEEFTGSETGDKVHIKFLSPIRTEWISHITDHGSDDKQAFFIDKGVVLPFPLAFWEHHHIVEKVDDHHALIVDDIRFRGRNGLLSWILYPAIYFGFLPRKKIYKSYFS